jgi:uncharacterized protein (TIGR02594 family)
MVDGLFCPAEFRPAPSTMASFADNSQFPWMEVALREIGIRERRGSRHNPRIVEYFASVTSRINDDETAWCSAFANWVMEEIGIEGSGRLNARSWVSWGQTVPNDSPHYGAITVLWRGSPRSWKGHVAFFCGMEGGNMILLGGNQGNAVSLRPYPARRLLSFRWPPGFPAPNMSVAV